MSRFNLFLIFIFLITTPGCISNLLKEPAPQFSDDIILPDVGTEFILQKTPTYPSWKNKITSNVISVISDCLDRSLTLKTAHSMVTNALDQMSVVEEKKISFKDATAYVRKTAGTLEDYKIEIYTHSFKHKNCFYVSALSGSPEKIQSDLALWSTFNQKIEFKK